MAVTVATAICTTPRQLSAFHSQSFSE